MKLDDRHFVDAAAALFGQFAERHGLEYSIDSTAPVEVMWRFDVQPKLSLPITLALQNGDELNFGVDDFWSYFFPFPNAEDNFSVLLDAWVSGEARIAKVGSRGRLLQLRDGSGWKTVYAANRIFPIWRKPTQFICNREIQS